MGVMLLQDEEELVGAAAVAVEDLLALFVGTLALSSQHEVGLVVVELPPLKVRLPTCHLLTLLEEQVLLHDLLLDITHLKEVLLLFRLQGRFKLFLLDHFRRVRPFG